MSCTWFSKVGMGYQEKELEGIPGGFFDFAGPANQDK
jgi:hypothetical protein